ncbi:MAG: Flp pilus assembly complex ATPase component TadA, partial [Gemmatimonadaceae bacterium]|nr:Flp pilus assembly complex ATPase component TadA [Caulobacter sp.]
MVNPASARPTSQRASPTRPAGVGGVWPPRSGPGRADAGLTCGPPDAERILRLVAHHVAGEIHAGQPRLSAELPGSGERFEGLMPPLVAAPTFSIRKPASLVFTLDDYVEAGVMSAPQA